MVYRLAIIKTSIAFSACYQLRSCNDDSEREYGVAIAYGSILIVVMMEIILFFDWIVVDTRISRSKAKKMN